MKSKIRMINRRRRHKESYSGKRNGITMEYTFGISMVLLTSLSIILIVIIFLSHKYLVSHNNPASNEGIIQNIISLQSITLTVTGISITVVSIVISLLSIYREKKIGEADLLISSLKQELSTIRLDTAEKQKN